LDKQLLYIVILEGDNLLVRLSMSCKNLEVELGLLILIYLFMVDMTSSLQCLDSQ
jgi:hypothetical protein